MKRASSLAWLVLVACSGERTQSAATPPPAAPPIFTDECRARPDALEAYDAITDGVSFSLEIMRDERGAWIPTHPLAMPLHHASTIAWTDDEHLLDAHASREPVVVVATGLGRVSIEHDEERGVWFATYAARVERVCPAE